MVRAVHVIEQDIAALEKLVGAIAQEFQDTYRRYLTELGQSVRQQLIMASYHLCTQGYPERFLRLSFNQRQQLQQSIRELARQAQAQLLAYLQPPDAPDPAGLEPLPTALPADEEPYIIELESPDSLISLADSSPATPAASSPPPDILQASTPEAVADWQEKVEQGVVEVLQTLSHAANRLLQQADVLPQNLPEPVLEVAAKADLMAEIAVGPPNLLNLLVETEDDDEEESSVAHIVAIRLRLSEIEFGTAGLSAWRSKIRELSNRLQRLGRDYQKKQRERAIAEAEAAWRSSWFED